MFRSFALFIAAHFQAVTFSHIFKFLNSEFLRYFFIGTYYLALSISRLLLFVFSFVISYFPYFKLVTLKPFVILCNTLKKEGRAFRNIGKNIFLYCVISLANFCLLFNLLLIRSSEAGGSGTSILSRYRRSLNLEPGELWVRD